MNYTACAFRGQGLLRQKLKSRGRSEALRQWARGHAEELVLLADHLPPGDRELVQAVLRDGQTVRRLARVGGGEPAALSLRLRTLLDRMRSPAFRLVALRGPLLGPDDRRCAQLLFLEGLSLRAAARRTGRPLHEVRRLRDAIRHLVRLVPPDGARP